MKLTHAYMDSLVLELARIAGDVANVCDHAEHNEPVDLECIRQSGQKLRALAMSTAEEFGTDGLALYSQRLALIENRNVSHHELSFDGKRSAEAAQTWRDLQLVQAEHDRSYHPDVIGLKKADQLRHYALHLAKLAGAGAGVIAGDVDETDFVTRRVADMLLFGIKLSTVSGEKLAVEPIFAASTARSLHRLSA
jgi:hypothetical protein